VLAAAATSLFAAGGAHRRVLAEPGRPGGTLVVGLRSEPKTLNPLVALDGPSREALYPLHADLIHINRQTQRTEPALAESWTVSPDGRQYTVRLRKDLAFSDGRPMDADDVVFTFKAHLDERSRSSQRDLLVVAGKPIEVTRLDAQTVRFDLAEPYAAAERLFDGFWILPRARLEKLQQEGKLAQAWALGTPPGEVAGLGPFRFKEYVAGQRLVLEKNPYYWKRDPRGEHLPYLDQVVFLAAGSEDGQVLRFQAGETDLLSRISADNFAVLEKEQGKGAYRLSDLGPGLEYVFLVFNLGDPDPRAPDLASRQRVFRELAFRRAISWAVDREAMVRLAFKGRAAPLAGHVTPGNRLWVDSTLPRPERSIERARASLRSAGFTSRPDGTLLDPAGQPVRFSIVTNAANAARVQMVTLIQDDLKALGIQVDAAPLENRVVLRRVLETRDFEAALLALGAGDADPNGEMNVWPTSGATHLWHLGQKQPATPWEAAIDDLMRRQLTSRDPRARKQLYDRVQELVAENLPIVPLVGPHVLVGAREGLANFRPALLEPAAVWNVEELFWRGPIPRTR
jgi:peptide/nickel transport system substrate-binding protein